MADREAAGKTITAPAASSGGKTTLGAAFREAVALHRDGRFEDAVVLYRKCLARQTGSATLWSNFGAALRSLGHPEASVVAHRKSLEIDPGLASARANLANALADIGLAEEAVRLRRALVDEEPESVDRLRDLCVALRSDWQHDEVIALIDAAEEKAGAPIDLLRLQRALSHLMVGDYARGFRDFESRYVSDEVTLPTDAPWPRWHGEDIAGKRIAVLPEQGFGDAILMARFLPALKARGAEVTLISKAPVTRLFAGLDGVDTHIAAARKTDAYDLYTPNMSLPHLVGVTDPPPPAPRLTIPQDSRVRARHITAPFAKRFRVGIVWTGSLTYRANHRRSVAPERFLGLAAVPGVQLFSLYKGDAHDDFVKAGLPGLIVDACGQDRDFADTAAIIDEMDLMITTDTAVVHVAGSLGKPVWNMLQYEGFWLYGPGETTPWYPSMRLFRQPAPGDWDSVFATVEARLRAHLAERRA